jgi:RNA polymerase sigma-70 factor (ECF subfamily)
MDERNHKSGAAPALTAAGSARSTPSGSDLPEKVIAEEAVLARALERHRPLLVQLALRLTRSRPEAEDLIQDAFERALRRPERLPPVDRLRPWLVTVLHNLFVDQCRRRARRPEHRPLDSDRIAAPPIEKPPRWQTIDPAELEAAVDSLDERFREVYRLHALEGRSYAEIAARLELQPSTVGTRLARARAKLRAILSEAEGAP